VRALRATLADMRALPSPVPSEQDQWALRSAISKARRKPAERYRRWIVGAGSAAAVAAAIVAGLTLTHTAKNTPENSAAKAIDKADSMPFNSGSPEIQFDSTNYNSASAKQLLAPPVAAVAAPAVIPGTSTRGVGGSGVTNGLPHTSLSAADRNRYRTEILGCEQQVFSHGSGGARAKTYIVGRYENTPVFFLIYTVVVGGKTKTEMWVVQQSNCYIRLFLAPQ